MAVTNTPRIRPLYMVVLIFWGTVAAASVGFIVQQVVRGVDGYINQPDFRTFYSSDKRLSFEYPNGYVTKRKNYGDGLTTTTLSQPRSLRNKTVNPNAETTEPLLFFSEHHDVSVANNAAEFYAKTESELDRLNLYKSDDNVITKERTVGVISGYPILQLTYLSVPQKDDGPTYGLSYSLLKTRRTIVLVWLDGRWYELELNSYIEPRQDELVKKIIGSLRVHNE